MPRFENQHIACLIPALAKDCALSHMAVGGSPCYASPARTKSLSPFDLIADGVWMPARVITVYTRIRVEPLRPSCVRKVRTRQSGSGILGNWIAP